MATRPGRKRGNRDAVDDPADASQAGASDKRQVSAAGSNRLASPYGGSACKENATVTRSAKLT
jgi:hypothetical protein